MQIDSSKHVQIHHLIMMLARMVLDILRNYFITQMTRYV